MNYVFLVHADETAVTALTPAERREIVDGHMAVYRELAERGTLRFAAPLADSPATRTLARTA